MSLNQSTAETPKKKKKLKWLFRDALFSTILSLVAFSLLSALIFSTAYFNPLLDSVKDFSFLDAHYKANFNGKGKIDPNLVLVNVGRLNRAEIADVINRIQEQKPAVLGLDIIFRDKQEMMTDKTLLNAISKENTVLPYVHYKDSINDLGDIVPLHTAMGYVNLTSNEATAVIRGFEGMTSSEKGNLYALSSQLVRQFKSGVLWNDYHFEDKLLKNKRIKFYGHYSDFQHYEAADILTEKITPDLTGKIVLLGYAGSPPENPYDIEDKHFTPLNQNPLGKGTPDMYGMVVHANIANMLLQNDFFWELGIWGQGILIFICSYLASLYFIWLDKKLKISYRTVRKMVLFVFAFVFVGCCLWLFGKNISVEPTLVVIVTIFSAGFVKYYKHLVRYVKTKRKFKSYIK